MKPNELIAHMLETSGKKAHHVSKEIGKSAGYLTAVMHKSGNNPTTNTLAAAAHACGYTLIAEGHGERIEIDPPQEPEQRAD